MATLFAPRLFNRPRNENEFVCWKKKNVCKATRRPDSLKNLKNKKKGKHKFFAARCLKSAPRRKEFSWLFPPPFQPKIKTKGAALKGETLIYKNQFSSTIFFFLGIN